MDNTDNSNNSTNSGNYGKRPLWQWIAIYAVIAVVVYGLVYYFILARGSGSTSGQVTQSPPAISQSVTPGSTRQSENAVSLTAEGFSPSTLTIKAGSTVTWTNNSGSDATVNSDPHPIHTNYPPLNLGSFSDGGTLSLVFDKAGTYGYHNHLNPSQKGTVIVQ